MTSTSSAWKPISLFITKLQHTVDRVPTETMFRKTVTSETLIPISKILQSRVREFSTTHPIPADAQETIQRIKAHEFKIAESFTVQRFMIELGMLQALLDPLSDFEARATGLTDRAFEHLQRSIVVDPAFKQTWQSAYAKGEPACEHLGAVHLLLHGIWAFKADSREEKTDLVAQERGIDPERRIDLVWGDEPIRLDQVRRTSTALVLTEWKRVTGRLKSEKAEEKALGQAKRYAGSVLAGLELESVRYLVLVSKKHLLGMPYDIPGDGGVLYRVVNIAVEPKPPSK